MSLVFVKNASADPSLPLPRLPICGDEDDPDNVDFPLTLNCTGVFDPSIDVQTYLVPGSGSINVQFDFVFREASYNNELGYFKVDSNSGTIGDLNPGDPDYLTAALQRAEVIFPGGAFADTPDKSFQLTGGDILVFFIVQDNSLANFKVENPTNDINQLPLAFFSIDKLNPDGDDHFVGFNGVFARLSQFGFEDLTDGGDSDYDDVVYDVSPPLQPLTQDSDGDALPDDWEVNGYDPDGNGPLPKVDLPSLGASKDRKDIFVEIDWMTASNHTDEPDHQAVQKIVDAFDNATVPYPDEKTGDINLHVDFDGKCLDGNPVPHSDTIVSSNNNQFNWTQFSQLKANCFSPSRTAIYHYVLFAHYLDRPCSNSGISRGSPSSDFIVSLGGWNRLLGQDICLTTMATNKGTPDQQAGTFMHELGHNLGLGHGGNDEITYKPNYLSVMNYSFQMKGLIISGKEGNFDYSSFEDKVPALNETSLDENIGLGGGGFPSGYGTRRSNCDPTHPTMVTVNDVNGPINWNCNKQFIFFDLIDQNPVRANINGFSDAERTVLKDDEILTPYNDWAHLRFDGGLIGKGMSVELPMITTSTELDPEAAALIEPLVKIVFIDIKPGGIPNPINIRSKGTIPVAILSANNFDAVHEVDSKSLTFGKTGNENSLAFCNTAGEDVNKDGRLDLVCHFTTRLTKFNVGDTIGILRGKLVDGKPIEGQDSVVVVK